MPQPRSMACVAWGIRGRKSSRNLVPISSPAPPKTAPRAQTASPSSSFVPVTGKGGAAGTGFGAPGQQEPRFLPGQLRLDVLEVACQHGVHAQAHMFDAAAREQDDVGRRVAGDGVGDFLEFRQRAGQLEQDQGGVSQELRAQREVFEACPDPQRRGVGPKCPFTGDEVLVDPDDGRCPGLRGPCQGFGVQGFGVQGFGVQCFGVQGFEAQGPQGQGPVPVPHYREPVPGRQQARRVQLKGSVQQEFVRGVPSLQIGGLDVRESSQPGKEGFDAVVRHARWAAVSSQAWVMSKGCGTGCEAGVASPPGAALQRLTLSRFGRRRDDSCDGGPAGHG